MDVIVIGIYSEGDTSLIEELAEDSSLKVIWNHDKYNVEAKQGIAILASRYHLKRTGIIIDNDYEEGRFFSSYPLIVEISDHYIETEWNNQKTKAPKLFVFFESLSRAFKGKCVLSFADEWHATSTVKIEKLQYKDLVKRLNRLFVWCEGYRNLQTNIEIRDESHPLVIELEN
jgi:hypothetical protein